MPHFKSYHTTKEHFIYHSSNAFFQTSGETDVAFLPQILIKWSWSYVKPIRDENKTCISFESVDETKIVEAVAPICREDLMLRPRRWVRRKHQTHSHTEARGINPLQVSASDLENDFISILTKTHFQNKAPKTKERPTSNRQERSEDPNSAWVKQMRRFESESRVMRRLSPGTGLRVAREHPAHAESLKVCQLDYWASSFNRQPKLWSMT